MKMNEESDVEPKFFPKVHVQYESRCFNIVDKCCMKIIKKSETGDNWRKILEREMCLTKIKYPFLSDKQIRGKALQQLGIPNFMGDIVRFGAHKVTGDLAKELNLVTVKKEPRIPPAFKFSRKPHIGIIDKEMKKLMKTSVSLPQDPPTSEAPEPPIDDNRSVTPKKSKPTDTKKHSPKRLFNYTPKFFRKRAQAGKNNSDDEFDTPNKVSKMARENPDDWKGYLSSSAEESPLATVDDRSQNVDEPLAKLKIECENLIYSQLSETSKRELLGDSAESTPKADNDPQNYSQILSPPQNLSNLTRSPKLSFLTENPTNREFLSPPIFFQTQTKRKNKQKAPAKNSPCNLNVKLKNPMFGAKRNLMNQWKNLEEHEIINSLFKEIQKASVPGSNAINQQLNPPYLQNTSECFVPSPRSSIQSDDITISQEFVSPGNFFINHLEKENRDVFPSNQIPFMNIPFQLPQNFGNNWGNGRQVFGEIQQPSNSGFNLFKTENSAFPFRTQGFSYNENTLNQIYNPQNFINPHLHQNIENSGFQAPRSFINYPLINNILLKEEMQSDDDDNLYELDSRSTLSMNSLDDEEKVPVSQLIPSGDMEITQTPSTVLISDDDEEQMSSQQIQSSDGIFESQGDDSSAGIPSLADEINPHEENVLNSQSQEEIPDTEKNEFFSSQEKINFSNDEMISSNIDDDLSEQNVLDGHKFSLMSQKEIKNSGEISSLQLPQSASPNLPYAEESQQSSALPTQSTSSMSPLPTDNYPENPWLNVTSQDFSQRSNLSQSSDSGKASQSTIASPPSFVSTTPEQSDNDTDEKVLSLNDMINLKVSTVKKNVERIICWLEREPEIFYNIVLPIIFTIILISILLTLIILFFLGI